MALDMYSMSDEVNFEDIRQSFTEVYATTWICCAPCSTH